MPKLTQPLNPYIINKVVKPSHCLGTGGFVWLGGLEDVVQGLDFVSVWQYKWRGRERPDEGCPRSRRKMRRRWTLPRLWIWVQVTLVEISQERVRGLR